MNQASFFGDRSKDLQSRIGADPRVVPIEPRSILTRASGFMSDYDYTLNPYTGCLFGCTYCYAAFFLRDHELTESWGEWVQAKVNAVEVLERMRTDLTAKSIYMSSVTDPYQPVERRLGLVRALLERLIPEQPQLVVQTRGPLVTRDIDLFEDLEFVRVNMTVTTDDDDVRRAFEPQCPSNDQRLAAIGQVVDAGVDAMITLTPLLPISDPRGFADQLLETGVRRFVVQPFHAARGRFVAGTRGRAVAISEARDWDDDAYARTVAVLHEVLPHLVEGREGFAP